MFWSEGPTFLSQLYQESRVICEVTSSPSNSLLVKRNHFTCRCGLYKKQTDSHMYTEVVSKYQPLFLMRSVPLGHCHSGATFPDTTSSSLTGSSISPTLKPPLFFFKSIFLFLAALGLHCCGAVLQLRRVGATLYLRGSSFSLWWLLFLESKALVARGLGSCDSGALELWLEAQLVGSSWIRDRTQVSCIRRWILYC